MIKTKNSGYDSSLLTELQFKIWSLLWLFFLRFSTVRELAENPYLGKELQRELSGFWSYRFLRSRIVYQADPEEKIIIVWAIGHRRDIYETLGRHLL